MNTFDYLYIFIVAWFIISMNDNTKEAFAARKFLTMLIVLAISAKAIYEVWA